MEFKTSLIDLDTLEVNQKKANNFSEEELEYLARTIVEVKGLIRIPLVRQKGIDSYKLISGYFDYYAFLKARELDEDLPDRIRVFILNDKNEKSILNQLEAIKKIEKTQTNDISGTEKNASTNINSNNLDIKLSNVISKFQDLESSVINQITKDVSEAKTEILETFESKLPKPLPILEAFNKIEDYRQRESIIKKISFVGKKKAEKIVNQLVNYKEKNKTEFKTFQDVLNALDKGTLAKVKMLDIIDNWN